MSQRNLSKIARSQAVHQVGSSEQLDQRLVVIGSSSWILLVVSAMLIALAITWGIFGSLPTMVEGEGVIVPSGTEPVQINSSSGQGGVVEVVVPRNTKVKKGDPLVKLANHQLEIKYTNAKAQLDMLESQDKRMFQAEQTILDRQKASLDSQIATCKQITDQTKKLSALYESELEAVKELVKAKLLAQTELVDTQQQYFSTLQQITQQETVIAKANEEYFSLVTSTQRDRLTRASQVEQARAAVMTADADLEFATLVRAPIDGTVIENDVDMGSSVSVGMAVASIRPHGSGPDDLIARLYVPYGTGRRIREGMTAWLSLVFVEPSRYGYIEAEVQSVSDFISGSYSSSNKLGSQELAEEMAKKLGVMLEVTVKIRMDDSTPTGLSWTSGRGYEHSLQFPALCGAKIIVDRSRPIDLVIPWIKDLIGLDPQVQLLADESG